jgi:predicted nucleic acid-binding protein
MAARRVVIADAGPLIALSRIAALPLLNRLFGIVWITEAVRREVCDGGSFAGQEAIQAALAAGTLRCRDVEMTGWQTRFVGVDAGEASAMALAESFVAEQAAHVLLIIDDRLGRLEAQSRGLSIIGTAGIIGLAKASGLVPSATELLRAMRANGYFLGEDVLRAVLARVGECE